MRIQFRLDEDLYQQVEIEARDIAGARPGDSKRGLSEVVRKSIEEHLRLRPRSGCPNEQAHAWGAWVLTIPPALRSSLRRFGEELIRVGRISAGTVRSSAQRKGKVRSHRRKATT